MLDMAHTLGDARGRVRTPFDPAEIVVWIATALLAVLCGLGLGFALWSVLAANAILGTASPAVYVVGIAIALVLPFAVRAPLRLFVALCGVALLLSFAFGGMLFAPLLGG